MKYEHIIKAVLEQPWAIMPEKLHAIETLLEFRAAGNRYTAEDIQAIVGAASPKPATRVSGSVAVVPVYGVIHQRMDMMSEMSGGTSTEKLSATIKALVADPAIGAIVLNVDSPGGGVYGVGELAAEILAARDQKPIVAVANSLAASAAYWLASAAGELVVTPGGEVGSVGVYAAHVDLSQALEQAGESWTLISAGKHKVDGNPLGPLSPEARDYMQQRVDEYYGLFVSAVAKGRGTTPAAVRSGFGEGRMVGAQAALKAGMVDRVATLDETIARLVGKSRSAAAARAEAPQELAAAEPSETLLAEHELDLRRRRARALAG